MFKIDTYFGPFCFSSRKQVGRVDVVVMETKGGSKKKSSSSITQYEAPLGYIIEDVRPHGGIEKFRSAAYSNVSALNTLMTMFFICVNICL